VHALTSHERGIIQGLVDALEQVPSVQAIVLDGYYARGMARAYSDIDLDVFYSDESPLPIPGVRDVTT